MSSSAPTRFPVDAGRIHTHENTGWPRAHTHAEINPYDGAGGGDGNTLSASFSSADDEIIHGHHTSSGSADNADVGDPDVIVRGRSVGFTVLEIIQTGVYLCRAGYFGQAHSVSFMSVLIVR